MNSEFEEKLKAFLEYYWLRPENGLVSAIMSDSLSKIKFESPSLDIGCGDGVFSFYHQGGKLESNSDAFSSTNASKFTHESKIDIFDADNEKEIIKIKNPSKIKIDYGTDWKQKLLNKAAKLELYKKLVLHDSNKPFPFEDKKFRTIFSDTVYWVKKENIPKLLLEINRMLHPEGTAALFFMTKHHFETLEKLECLLDKKAIDILDRGRRESVNSDWGYQEWETEVKKAGFKIVEVVNTYPNNAIVDIWNVGLRPIAHLLIQMTDKISTDERIRIKKEWTNIFLELFKNINKIQDISIETQGYPLFILKK